MSKDKPLYDKRCPVDAYSVGEAKLDTSTLLDVANQGFELRFPGGKPVSMSFDAVEMPTSYVVEFTADSRLEETDDGWYILHNVKIRPAP